MSSASAYTGNIPHHYEQYLGPILFEPYAADLAARVTSHTRSLLELACGTGRVTQHLDRRLAASARLVATDLNRDMLHLARSIVFSPRVEWMEVDAQHLPFGDALFDVVLCQFGVMFFADKLAAFREVYRVLEPRGRFLFNTWDGYFANPRAALLMRVMNEELGARAPDLLSTGPYSFHNQAQIVLLLEEAGFHSIRLETVARKAQYTDPNELVEGFVEGSPVGAYLDRLDRSLRPKIKARLHAALGEQLATYGHDVPMQAIVVEAVK
ncbi:class I SAM-dependent methyltransferase [Flaviaesturariibacter aridisoli]|uniref:Methyltransferase domain-containing protein n=1 Tax=Flaviaesturariibacter aridisoli TaxID=2545761 RepID=A0A4V2WM26_9BACT|nr:methyltransferase domain-containing protein [Flaviaesturariibacter aridisoli]TCZ65277.1 methyltransferase domain-containing protein [Flaviaesturariibacter aridisoli]